MKFKGRWRPEKESYKEACLRLARNLSNFKRDKDYIPFVGNDIRGADVVSSFDKVVKSPYVSENDVIGNPILHNGKSAATLRFMKVVEDTDGKNIIEIGGGYGGQCLVYKTMRDVMYSIIDIPSALALSSAYLLENEIDCKFISSENVGKVECDLLISDFCLSELDEVGIDFYLDRVKFEKGYFTINQMSDYIPSKLEALGYTVTVEDENPKTSRHKNQLVRCHFNNV